VSPPVRGFALTGAARACATPEGAYANCLALSARYTAWLRDRGAPAGMLVLRGSRDAYPSAAGRWPDCDPEGYAHWVTISGGLCVDWTWRQFEPRADWPVVLPVGALAGAWRDVRVWACEACPDLVADSRHLALAHADLHRGHRSLARATGGAGPFPDPRHDADAVPLSPMCSCAAGARTSTAADVRAAESALQSS
jgi:hypothetical protein